MNSYPFSILKICEKCNSHMKENERKMIVFSLEEILGKRNAKKRVWNRSNFVPKHVQTFVYEKAR